MKRVLGINYLSRKNADFEGYIGKINRRHDGDDAVLQHV